MPGVPHTTGPVGRSTGFAGQGHGLAVALHVELLQVVGKLGQVVVVGEDGLGLGAEEVVVPDPDQAQEHREVLLERGGAEVVVDGMEPVEHLGEAPPGRWRS